MAAGIPAKVICSLEEYLNKKESKIIHTGGLDYKNKKNRLIKRNQNGNK
jgi:hypothetical protein